MMPDRYRRMTIGLAGALAGTLIISFIWGYFAADIGAVISIMGIFFISILLPMFYAVFCYFNTKKHNPGKARLDHSSLDQFIVKMDAWFFKRLMLFDADGHFIGKATLKIDSLKSLLLSHLSHYMILVPIFYEVKDYEGNLLVKFKRQGFRSAIVNIYDGNDRYIGKVEFDELRVILKFRGHAFTGGQTYKVSSEYLFEDVKSGIMTIDSFSNRVEYHYIFREMSNEVATFKTPVSTDDGKVALALLCMLYYLRTSSN